MSAERLSTTMPLSYRDARVVRAFVCIAKAGVGGLTLVELEQALGYAHRSAAVDDILKALLRWRVIRRERMWMQRRAPYRMFAHVDAQKRAGALTFAGWDRKHRS